MCACGSRPCQQPQNHTRERANADHQFDAPNCGLLTARADRPSSTCKVCPTHQTLVNLFVLKRRCTTRACPPFRIPSMLVAFAARTRVDTLQSFLSSFNMTLLNARQPLAPRVAAHPGSPRVLLPRHAQAPSLIVQQGRSREFEKNLPPSSSDAAALADESGLPDGLVPGEALLLLLLLQKKHQT